MRAVISGASRGIGRAIALMLAEKGYDLLLLARQQKGLDKVKKLIGDSVSVDILPVDLSEELAIELLEKEADKFANVTVLVNNLGVYSTQSADEIDLNLLTKQLEVNLYSAIRLTQTVLKFSSEKGLKNVVNIGSVMSLQASEIASDYSISKHAFKAWNDGLREKLRTKGIKVSAIYPGSVNTSSWDGIGADRESMIQPEDIAELVTTLLIMKPNTLVDEIRVSPRNFKLD